VFAHIEGGGGYK